MNNKPKILFINSLDNRYGSTYRARHIVRAIKELGFECVYVESNLKDFDFKDSISIKQGDDLFGYISATLKRCSVSLRANYDIIFIQKFTPLTVPCIIIAKLRRKKCIVDWDDLDFSFQDNFLKKILVFFCEHFFSYFADLITTHSCNLKKYANSMGIKRIEILNQIVDFAKIEISSEEKERLKEEIGAKGKKVLCFLGTLTTGGAGDLDIIIRAVSEVAKIRGDILFLIIGGGPLQEKYKKILEKYNLSGTSHITGTIEHSQVQKYLSIADIGLIYMRDSLGNQMRVSFKVLEYFAAGIPVVGHMLGETEERFSKNCLLCNDDLSDFITKVMRTIDIKIQLDSFHINSLLQNYSLNNIKASLREIINNAIAN